MQCMQEMSGGGVTVTVTVRGGVGIGRGASGRTTVLPNACCTKSFGDSSAGRNLASVWEYPILGVSCSGSPGASSVSMGWFGIGDLGQTGAMGWGIDHSGKHGKGLGGGVGQGVEVVLVISVTQMATWGVGSDRMSTFPIKRGKKTWGIGSAGKNGGSGS